METVIWSLLIAVLMPVVGSLPAEEILMLWAPEEVTVRESAAEAVGAEKNTVTRKKDSNKSAGIFLRFSFWLFSLNCFTLDI